MTTEELMTPEEHTNTCWCPTCLAQDRCRAALAAAQEEVARLQEERDGLAKACRGLIERVRILLLPEKKPTLAAWPKSGVEYVGVDVEDCAEVKEARAALAKSQ